MKRLSRAYKVNGACIPRGRAVTPFPGVDVDRLVARANPASVIHENLGDRKPLDLLF